MQYKIKAPNYVVDHLFNDYDDCYNVAKDIVSKYVKFASIWNKDRLLTTIIRSGYGAYNFNQYNVLELNNRIADFFVLHNKEKQDIYYIKLKTIKK